MARNFNMGLTTSMKGAEIEGVRVTGLNVANGQLCTVADQGNSGAFSSVTHTATGVYTFQMSVPFPARVICVSPELSAASPAGAILTSRYQDGSYNATTGQFIVNVSNATPAAADGGAATEMHVVCIFERYSTLRG